MIINCRFAYELYRLVRECANVSTDIDRDNFQRHKGWPLGRPMAEPTKQQFCKTINFITFTQRHTAQRSTHEQKEMQYLDLECHNSFKWTQGEKWERTFENVRILCVGFVVAVGFVVTIDVIRLSTLLHDYLLCFFITYMWFNPWISINFSNISALQWSITSPHRKLFTRIYLYVRQNTRHTYYICWIYTNTQNDSTIYYSIE